MRYPCRQEQQKRVMALIQNLGLVLQNPRARVCLAPMGPTLPNSTAGSFAAFSTASMAAMPKPLGLQDGPRNLASYGPRTGNGPSAGKPAPDAAAGSQPVATDYARYIGRSAGSRQCVALVQATNPSIGLTRTWKCGAAVRGNTDLAPGTAIATFDGAARYANALDGSSHAAIYLGQNERGIQVMDQWAGSTAAVRTIPWTNPSGKAANTGSAFHVVRSA